MIYASIVTYEKKKIWVLDEPITLLVISNIYIKNIKFAQLELVPDVVDVAPDLANNGIPPLLPLSLDEDVEVYRNLRILKVFLTFVTTNVCLFSVTRLFFWIVSLLLRLHEVYYHNND